MKPRSDADTALLAAVREGDLSKESDAFTAGADVNTADTHGVTRSWEPPARNTWRSHVTRHRSPNHIQEFVESTGRRGMVR